MRIMPVLTLVVMVAALAVAPVVVQAQLANAPDMDNNNRIVGEDGGNIFYNGLSVGETLTSELNLDIPGSSASPDGASPAASIVTISEIADGVSVLAEGDNTAEAGGITASLNGDGSYSVTADDGFDSDLIVSFGVPAGDFASLLVAPETNIDLSSDFLANPATGTNAPDAADLSSDGAEITVAVGQGVLVVNPGLTVEVGEYATVSFDYEASATVNVAAIGFDGGLNGLAVNYVQLDGANVASGAGAMKNVAVTFSSQTGSIVPAFQIVNTAADGDPIEVSVSNFKVINAGPLNNYQVDPNVMVDVAALADWNLAGINNPAGTASVADGVLSLEAGTDTVANAYGSPAVPEGTVTLEAMVQAVSGVGDGDDAEFFALVLTDGGNTINAYVPASELSEMTNVSVSGTTTTGMGASFFVTQASEFNANVESAVIYDVEGGVDPAVIGM